MASSRRAFLFWGIVALFLILVSVPYLLAELASGPDHVFGGFLLNPIDGNSYLAKMQQGWRGEWTFTLPYTAEPGEGAYLFLYYLFLGHIARLTGLPLLLTFHLARLLGTVLLLASLYRFTGALFDQPYQRNMAFVLAAFGSGLGWLALVFGGFTPDFWVAEAYPFLSAYANAHFPLGLALQIWLLTPSQEAQSAPMLAFAALLLAVVMPFGVVVVGLLRAGLLLWQLILRQPPRVEIEALFWIALGSGPLTLYYLWVTRTHPALSVWNAQNLTPSPPLWALLLALSPAFLLALPGALRAWGQYSRPARLLLTWTLLGLLLLYLPVGIQRRFISAYYLPLACLAVMGIDRLTQKNPGRQRLAYFGTMLFSTLTNLIVLLSGIFASLAMDEAIFLHRAEASAFTWMEENTPAGAIFLAAPDTGLRIPAYTHGRVLYGHPFETVRAEETEDLVLSFFEGRASMQQLNATLEGRSLDHLFLGPREASLGEIVLQEDWQPVYRSEGVTIYRLGE